MHGQYHERRADDDSADVSRVVSGDFFFLFEKEHSSFGRKWRLFDL